MMDHTPLAVVADICGYAICSADNRLEHTPSMMNSLELNVSSTEHCFLAPVSFRRAPSERRCKQGEFGENLDQRLPVGRKQGDTEELGSEAEEFVSLCSVPSIPCFAA
jgi:hypothetical protein